MIAVIVIIILFSFVLLLHVAAKGTGEESHSGADVEPWLGEEEGMQESKHREEEDLAFIAAVVTFDFFFFDW